MNAVGILGSYISKGVYTVSAPFHPFGGAVDIVVVEQQDGSFKSSPWYVRFGKFQGVLKAKEKVVNIIVNGVEANFAMYLDHKGEAYFLREVDVEGEFGSYPSSSGDEAEGKLLQELDGRRILSSKSCNSDARSSIDGIEMSKDNGKIVMKTSSRQRILGFVWGRSKSIKEDRCEDTSVARVDSLERAEIAADLLEVRWSTNLCKQKLEKSNSSKFSSIDTSDRKDEEKLKTNDGNSHVASAVEGITGNNLDKDCETCSEHITNGSQLALEDIELSIEVTREISSLNSKDRVVETSIIGEKAFDGTYEVKSAAIDIEKNGKHTVDEMGKNSENANSKSQISWSKNRDLYNGRGENFIGERLSEETNIVSQVFSISEEKSEPHAAQSSMFHETSKTLMLSLDDSMVLTHKFSHLANGGSGIVGVHTEGLHVTTEVHLEDTDSNVVAEDFEIETEKVKVLINYSQQVDRCNTSIYEGNTMDQGKPLTLEASYSQIVSTEEMPGSVKELKSDSIVSSFSSDFHDDKSVDGSVTSKFQDSLNSIGNRVITESHIIPSENSDDEQFLFSDFDVPKTEVNGNVESDSQHYNYKAEYPLVYPSSTDEEDRFVNRSYETCTSLDSHEIFNQGITKSISIPQSHPISNAEVVRLAASLPNMQAGNDNPIVYEISHPLSHSVDSNLKPLKWMELCKDSSSSNLGGDGKEKAAEECSKTKESWASEEPKSVLPNSAVGSPAEATVYPVGNWKLWPFSFKRSSSGKGTQSAVDDYTDFDIKKASDRNIGVDGEASILKHKTEKKMVRSISPTSKQLASLNLKEGGNTVIFTFHTAVLGKQQVDARIYLWKSNTRVVISDVDGTITKSDVLGQFMPFVGMDWSQTGVTNLFSAIKENGYQLLFLSARSISQAYHTRQFLFNLKQDGKALPEGPVVISPDGLFPSLYREVIRRAPHEFKIACLERIRELFPPDCNPFYAGFGNRDTDEFSYLKVGIPKGKIFIINPKGEVVVNRRVDTKSYTSLHTLVNGMFPPMTSSEQEDFNSWNYWKLPPPVVDF